MESAGLRLGGSGVGVREGWGIEVEGGGVGEIGVGVGWLGG